MRAGAIPPAVSPQGPVPWHGGQHTPKALLQQQHGPGTPGTAARCRYPLQPAVQPGGAQHRVLVSRPLLQDKGNAAAQPSAFTLPTDSSDQP